MCNNKIQSIQETTNNFIVIVTQQDGDLYGKEQEKYSDSRLHLVKPNLGAIDTLILMYSTALLFSGQKI